MQLLSSCISNGKTDEALKIISDISSHIDSDTEIKKYSNNMMINAVVSYYAGKCRKEGISFSHDIRIKEPLPCDDMSFAVVISNGLENAFNACIRMEESSAERFITMTCLQQNDRLFLEIKNSFSGTISFDKNGKLPVSMDEDHGIGTRSISSFADKNNAILDYDADDGIFAMHLLLYI